MARRETVPDSSPRFQGPRDLRSRRSGAAVSQAVRAGYKAIYNVVVVNQVVLFCRRHRMARAWPLGLLAVAAWPLWLNFALMPLPPGLSTSGGRSLLVFGGFAVLDTVGLLSAWLSWSFAYRGAHRIDEMLAEPADRKVIARSVGRAMGRRQLGFTGACVCGGMVFLALTAPGLEHVLGVKIASTSYFMIAWTCFIGGNDIYWILVGPALPRLLYYRPSLMVRWADPASTPGIQLLARAFGVQALLLLAETISFVVLAFALPGFFRYPPLTGILAFVFFLFVLLSFRLSIYSNLWLYLIITREKDRFRDELVRIIGPASALGKGGLPPDIAARVSIYQSISSVPNMPFSTGAIVQYSATIIGITLTFIIQLLLKVQI